MPRIATKPKEEVQDKPRSPKQLANDERLRNRKLAPVVIRPSIESSEQPIAQEGTREFDKNNELPRLVQKVTKEKSLKWLEDMAFANEIVAVIVHESTDKLAHPFPEIIVNGRVQRFVRGNEQKVRRCFVEKLARLKLTAYDNLKTKDVDGEYVYRYPSHTALLYPFVIINPTEKDRVWLKKIEQEP